MSPPNAWHRNRLIRDAMYAALGERMDADPACICLGEGNHIKAMYDAPKLYERYPDRFLTMPIAEDACVNFAVGAAIGGMVPVFDCISSDFLFRCADGICNTAAKLASVGQPRTIVIKAEFMTGGPTSGQRIEGMFVGVPGLSVCCPSTPWDAHTCMKWALNHKGVTVMFEDRMIEDASTPERHKYKGPGLRDYWEPRRPGGRIRRYGDKLTIVSYGLTSRLAVEWLLEHGPSTEPGAYQFIDLCWLYPIAWQDIIESIECTGNLLVIEPDSQYAGIGAEIIAHVAEHCPGVKVARMGAPRVSIPASRDLHHRLLPTREAVLAKCREMAG